MEFSKAKSEKKFQVRKKLAGIAKFEVRVKKNIVFIIFIKMLDVREPHDP